MKKLKIAQVCPKYFPSIGGVETHVKAISEHLVSLGYEIEVLTTNHCGNLLPIETINGVEVKRFKTLAPSEAYWFSKELKTHLKKHSNDYDIIHAHSYHAFPSLYAAEYKGANKFVFTPHYHGTGHTFIRRLLHIPYKYFGKKIFDNADAIIFVSAYEKNLALKSFCINEKKIQICPNGVNLEDFKSIDRKKKPSILYVGRLEKYKGIDYVIRVLPKLDPCVYFEIVGKGPYKEKLLKLANKLGVNDRVKFFQDLTRAQLLQKYMNAGIFVMLSQHESFGIVIAEALASGTACIVANNSALTEWVDNKSCFGIEYPVCMEKLARLINDKILLPVDHVRVPDWKDVVDKLCVIYKNL